jgi:hypothetical protein
MRKNLITASLTAMMLMGFAGSAIAQSDAMQEAENANDKPLDEGSGVTASGKEDTDKESGHSDAANQSLDAVDSETDEATDVPDSKELDDINAEGQSDAAGDAIESQ